MKRPCNQHTVRVYDLRGERVHVESTSARAYTSVSEGGLFQFGHSKDHRPDLPQVKVMQAVLDPWACPWRPMWCRVSVLMIRSLSRVSRACRRVWAARGCCTWAIAKWRRVRPAPSWRRQGDYSLCPLPQVQLAEGELDEALAALWRGDYALSEVWRAREQGEPELIAQGYERQVPMRLEVEGVWQQLDGAALGGPLAAPGQGRRGGPARSGGQGQGAG